MKKGSIAALVLAGSPKKDVATSSGDKPAEEEMADEGEMVAQDILDALEAKDAAALSEALKAHYAVCASEEPEDEDEDFEEY